MELRDQEARQGTTSQNHRVTRVLLISTVTAFAALGIAALVTGWQV